jgi:hypothetical protein
MIREAAEPLPDFQDPAFGALFDRYAGAKVILLGEASHGTSEFYRARAAITKRLIEEHGFNIVAARRTGPMRRTSTATCGTARGAKAKRLHFSASPPGCGATPTSTPSCAG